MGFCTKTMKYLLLLFPLISWGTTTLSSVVPTSTQAIVRYQTTSTSACTVEVSTSATYSPLALDLDPALYSGSNLDSREPYLNTSGERVFVVGKRITQRDSSNVPRSRALQAATLHFLRITCGGDVVTDTFVTLYPPFGLTSPDTIQADPLSAGDPLWPYLDYTDTTKSYVDPHNGLLLHRATGPGDNQYSGGSINVTWSTPNIAKYPTAGAWSAASLPTSITNNSTDYLILRLDTAADGNAGGVDFFNFNASASYTSEQLVSLNNLQTSLTGSINQATCNSVVTDACKQTVCISVDSVTCHPSSANIDVAFTTTGTAYTLGDQTFANIGGWIKPGYRPINSVEAAKRTGTAICNGTTTVTGGPFNLSWSAGSLITINGTVYTIAAVRHEALIILTSSCSTGTFGFVGKNFSLLVRAKTTNSNTFTLTAGSTQVRFGVAPSAPAGENEDVCSFTTVNDVSGNPGYNCFSSIGIFWVSAATGEGRQIIPTWVTDATGLHLLAYQMMTFDGTDADTFYGFGNGFKRMFKYKYMGDHALLAWPAEAPATTCNDPVTPTNKPCLVITELTVNGVTDVADLVHAYNSAFDKSVWVAFPVGTNQYHGAFILMFKRNNGSGEPQNGSYAWITAFDPSAMTNSRPGNAGCVGGGNPGCFIAVMGAYAALNMRGVNTKGGIQSDTDTGVIEFGPQFTCFNSTINGTGCMKVDISGGFSFSATPDVTGGPTDCPVNPYGVSGKNCTVVTVTSEPYDPNPGTNETGLPGEYITAAAGDVLGVNIVTVGSGFPFLSNGQTNIELVRILIKSGNTWTLQRHFQYGFDNFVCPTVCLEGSPTALGSTTNPSIWYTGANGNAYWDFVNDPSGAATVLNHGIGTHAFLRRGVYVQGTASGPPCTTDIISGCNMLTYSSSALVPATTAVLDPTGIGTSNPSFAGSTGIAVANGTQSHPSASGLSANEANRVMFYDTRPYNGVYGSSSGAPQASSVSGTLWKFAAGAITVNRKKLPTHATTSASLLTDVSGPSSSIGTTSSDYYNYCVVLTVNECRSGSVSGEIYFNVPYLQYNFCFVPGQATSGADNTDVCIHDQSPADDTIMQLSSYASDPQGLHDRVLTAGFATPRVNAPFWNIFMNPVSGIGITRSKYVNKYRADWLSVKMPPLSTDSKTRNDFLQTQVLIPASTFTHAIVEWGYQELGSDGTTKFYCTSRADNCRTGGSPFTYASETQNPTSCSSGCAIPIPVIANRTAYYRILRTDSSGNVKFVGTTQVFAVH